MTVTADSKPVVLIVDDTPDVLSLISQLLQDTYRIKVANNGRTGLQLACATPAPDLVLLDVNMPDLDGLQVCRELKAHPSARLIPVIFLSGKAGLDDEEAGLALGAADYISKPVSPAILRARVATHIALKQRNEWLRDQAALLEHEVDQRTRELAAAQDATILAMSMLAETRDMDTGNHIRRTQNYVKVLAEKLLSHPKFQAQLTPREIDQIYKSAPLHDIGKVGIPDRILLKPGKLDPDEYAVMKTHTTIGFEAIVLAEKILGAAVPHLRMAKEIVLSHQEWWDGTGYPQGLAAESIPVSARLMAIADVYDALISTRVYKEGLSHDRAVQIIFQGRGTHFDPDMVDAFIEIQDEFAVIAERFADDESLLQQKMEYMAQAIAEQA